MSYDEALAERCRSLLSERKEITEKKMFGGLSFLLHGTMICGVLGDRLVVRIDPSTYDRMLEQPFVSPMDFTGRPMLGFLYVAPGGLAPKANLSNWIQIGLEEGRRQHKGPSKAKKNATDPKPTR